MVRGDASEASRISVSPTKLVGPMQKRPLLTAFVTMAAALFVSGAARAESDTVEVRGAVESGAALPSTSDKPLLVSLELMMPLLRRETGARILFGVAPRAVTQDRFSSNLPHIVALGGAGTVRFEF